MDVDVTPPILTPSGVPSGAKCMKKVHSVSPLYYWSSSANWYSCKQPMRFSRRNLLSWMLLLLGYLQ